MRILEGRQGIPWAMAAVRAMLGPLLIAGARSGWNGFALAGIVLSALLSDIFDGVLARRWGCDTAAVRLFDTLADTVFYLCTAIALWFGAGHVLRGYGPLLVGLAAFEGFRFAFDAWKFGKPASYHSYLAKTWGLVLASAIIAGFALGRTNVLVPWALWIGVLCNLEGLAMSLMLPVWHRDVKTLAAAWRLRKEWKRARAARPLPPFFAALMSGVILLVVVPGAFAMGPGDAIYMSGTSAVLRGTTGQLDVTFPGELVFRTAGGNAAIAIPYANIKDFAYHSEVRQQLGVLPFLAVGLFIKQPRKHLYTITYTDAQGVVQVAVFEVPKDDFEGLCAILLARSPAQCRGTCPTGAR
jgi:CDP-diacylglycerol--glycerol-3-phosphate 3-phosphatidyltransferase